MSARKCRCGTILNSYNMSGECGPCAHADYQRHLAKSREDQEKARKELDRRARKQEAMRERLHQMGEVRQNILLALPGNARQIADRTGYLQSRVTGVLYRMRESGIVTAEQEADAATRRYFYRAVDAETMEHVDLEARVKASPL